MLGGKKNDPAGENSLAGNTYGAVGVGWICLVGGA